MGTLPHLTDTVLVWYDFICPFCYVGQQRTRILADAGLRIVELPFQAHPEIPVEGTAAPCRSGPMYDRLAEEAAAAGLPINWPPRLPNSRLALAAAEWTRRNEPGRFALLHKALFDAHFVNAEDIGDPATVDRHLCLGGIDPERFWDAMDDGTPDKAVADAETAGRSIGVRGTPAWLIGGRLISGLRPSAKFEQLAGEQQQAVV